MKGLLLIAFGLTLSASHAIARIGDTPAKLQERFGKPLRVGIGVNGSGVRVYCSDAFPQIRVTFIEGISEKEEYLSNKPSPPELIALIREENPNQDVSDRPAYSFEIDRGVGVVITVQSERALDLFHELYDRDQREHAYSGKIRIREDGDWHRGVLQDHNTVVEIPIISKPYLEKFELVDGAEYEVTVLDQDSEDIYVDLAVIGKREHVDWHDCVDDGVGGIQQLVRIRKGDHIVFDRSICSVHHVKMDLREVEIGYGMYAWSSQVERYCIEHYPNFRDFALGGCVVGDAKSTSIYICPKCVGECKDWGREHPDKKELSEDPTPVAKP